MKTSIKVLIGTLLLAIFSQLSVDIPGPFVPITGQTYILLVVCSLLKPIEAFSVVALYIIAAGAGAPILSKGRAGYEFVLGPSFGFLIGFLISAPLISKIKKKVFMNYMGIHCLILLCGWLGLLRYASFGDAFKKGVLPFLVGVVIKSLLAFLTVDLVKGTWFFLRKQCEKKNRVRT